MISLELNFSNIDELYLFVLKMNPNNNNVNETEKIKKPKKSDDKRGLNVKQLHINAKKYQEEHPEISYRQALKLGNSKEELN